jgi:hypothetical protein
MKISVNKKIMKPPLQALKHMKNRCEQATIKIKLLKIMQKTTLTIKHLMKLEQV